MFLSSLLAIIPLLLVSARASTLDYNIVARDLYDNDLDKRSVDNADGLLNIRALDDANILDTRSSDDEVIHYIRSFDDNDAALFIRTLLDNQQVLHARSLEEKYYDSLSTRDTTQSKLYPRSDLALNTRSPSPRGGGGGGKASPKPKIPKKSGSGATQCNKTPLSPDMKGKADHCSRVKNSFGDASAIGSVGPCGAMCGAITGAIQNSMIDKVCTKEVKEAMASQVC